jgi:hypothetical protein
MAQHWRLSMSSLAQSDEVVRGIQSRNDHEFVCKVLDNRDGSVLGKWSEMHLVSLISIQGRGRF